MNHLAHFHLSYSDFDNEGLLIGALLADFVKGPLKGNFPSDWEAGIQLHRNIDGFTDRHPIQGQIRQRLPKAFSRYSGIIADIAFDHFLANHWQHFHHHPLGHFSNTVFAVLNKTSSLPENVAFHASRMAEFNVLARYQEWSYVEDVFERLATRFKRENPLPEAAPQLEPHYKAIEQEFLTFYPELIGFAEEQKTELLKG